MSQNKIIDLVLGPSPLLYGVRYMHSHRHLFFRGGETQDMCYSDDGFFEIISKSIDNQAKPRRGSAKEIRNLFSNKSRLTKNQRLVKSILDEVELSRNISSKQFESLKEMYEFRRKYKNYLRIKRIVPLSLIAPFTNTELSKMAYAAALGSKSISLTVPGLIGYSLPAYFFFHMSSYYVPDKIKPICQVCKYTLGAPLWMMSYITDEFFSPAEEMILGESVPIDLLETGGTIPKDIGDINKLVEVFEDMKDFGKDFNKKSY